MRHVDFPVFDADNHYYEDEDAFTRYVPKDMQKRCMQWAEINGKKRLLVAGQIREPGLYNHFAGKQALYEAVLFRALNPMAQALVEHMERASSLREYTDLPAIITDIAAGDEVVLERTQEG